MNRAICEWEEKTAAAIDCGTIDEEVASHAEHCPVCSEILLLSDTLRATAALTRHELSALPDPARIWQKARRQAVDDAVRKALRPILFMKIVAVGAFAASPWLRWLLPIARKLASSWWKTFDLNLAFAPKIWPVDVNQAVIFLGCSGTILLLGLSSWYMLREE